MTQEDLITKSVQLDHETILNSQQLRTAILRGFYKVNQCDIAEIIKVDESTLSRFLKDGSGKLSMEQITTMLSCINLKLVEREGGETITIPVEEYDALKVFAKKGLGNY